MILRYPFHLYNIADLRILQSYTVCLKQLTMLQTECIQFGHVGKQEFDTSKEKMLCSGNKSCLT